MELVDIAVLLGKTDCRLLTLVGLGGIGKTRLALQTTEHHKEHFADGVHFILLASLQSASNIAATILNTLKIPLSVGQTPEESLQENLKDKEILLALDNFEHLLAGASLLGTLLEKTKKLKFLVTSREPLNITWEHTFEVHGLRYPDSASTKDFANYDAVRLFTRTAQQVNSHFQLKTEHYPAILEICRIVEGMPLGLELAASWLQTFSCQQIAQILAENIGIVESTLKDIPERHRSLDHVFEHSWRLLGEPEQNMLSKLAIFRGGFDKEAAKVITNASYITLVQLKQKSLVRKASEERFDMHEVIRQGAEKKLKENDGVYQETRTKFSHYYLDFLAKHSKEIQTNQVDITSIVETNLDNVREAWYWAVDKLNADKLYASLETLHLFHMNQARPQEALQLYNYSEKQFRKYKETQNLFFPRVLEYKAWFLNRLGNVEEAILYANESLELSQSINHKKSIIESLQMLGVLEIEIGNYSQGRLLWQEGLDLAKESNETLKELLLLTNLAIVEEQEGNYKQAEAYYHSALTISKQLGQTSLHIKNLNNLATFLLNTNRFDEAAIAAKKGIELAEGINQLDELPYLLLKLARIASFHKNYDEAWQLAQKALTLAQEQNNKPFCAKLYHFLGETALATKHISQSSSYLGQGLKIAVDVNNSSTVHDILISIAKLYNLNKQTEQAINLLYLLLRQSPLVKSTEENILGLLDVLDAEIDSKSLGETPEVKSRITLQESIEKFLSDYC